MEYPQGSVLGPILFLIYINDLGELPLYGKLISFAEDTYLVYSASNSELLQKAFDVDEKVLGKYLLCNKLILWYINFSFKFSTQNQVIFQAQTQSCRWKDCECPLYSKFVIRLCTWD